jgi:hypothetical protein
MSGLCDPVRDRQDDKPEERVIRGAEAIAEFIFGDRSHRRKVYYLAECCKIPIHRLGSTLCLRPSAYKSWIESQQNRAVVNAKHGAEIKEKPRRGGRGFFLCLVSVARILESRLRLKASVSIT